MYRFDANGQLTMLELEAAEGTGAPPKRRPGKPDSELVSIPYFHLDLVSGSVDLFGQRHWELRSPWRKGKRPLNTGAAPRIPIRVPLSGILEANPAQKYYLSKVACIGILRRAFERGKELPQKLERALRIQAGLMRPDGQPTGLEAYHINQRDEGIDLHGVSGALLATTNMQMQTFVTQPDDAVEGFDGYNGDLTGDVAATLGVNCGMSTGRNGIMAFAANQRDEVRDLRDVAGALQAQPGMKQQTFVAGFSAGAGASAGGIGYNESVAPTLKGSPGGNCMPSVLCLNDQGGSVMNCSENISGTLRAQEHGHQPLVYDNHGIDSRYTGPHKVAPTMSARYDKMPGQMRSEKDVVCKPFKNHHAEQLKLVTDFDWIDFDRLSDVDELISSVLSCEEAADYIDEGRIHAITESVQRRIGHLQELAMTQTPRQLDTTEDDVREEVAADYAPKMEL